MKAAALRPRISVFHSRLNATLLVGQHLDRHVIARMCIAELDGTQDDTLEIIYDGATAEEADERLLAIIQGRTQLTPV